MNDGKMLNIIPIHDDGHNCLEDLLFTLSKWLKRNYEMIFINSWNFIYEPDFTYSRPLGTRIKPNNNVNQLDLLEKYHGIRITMIKQSPEELLAILKSELKSLRPVLVVFDSYYCPWMTDYKFQHHFHTFMATGIDDDSNIHCIDCTPINYGDIISQEDFLLGVHTCGIIDYSKNELDNFDWRSVLESSLNNLYVKSEFNMNVFESIIALSSEIEKHFDLSAEVDGYPNIWDAPLFMSLMQIDGGRKQFGKVCKYIAKKNGIRALEEYAKELELLSAKWGAIRGVMMKNCFKGSTAADNTGVSRKISDKLKEIAGLEEMLASTMLRFLKSGSTNIRAENQYTATCSAPGEIVFVDLDRYYNNRGFEEAATDSAEADLTGLGEFLLKVNVPSSWDVGNMKFLYKVTGFYDNVSCSGQVIQVEPNYYQSIMLLACGEWGNFLEKIILNYSDGTKEEIFCGFTDWNCEELFQDTIAWSGKSAEKKNGSVRIIERNKFIHAKEYPINGFKVLNSLCLPDCPNIHLFAMSLRVALAN